MTKKEFTKILKEYKYNDEQIEILWNSRPSNIELDEEILRETAKTIAPHKDTFIQL